MPLKFDKPEVVKDDKVKTTETETSAAPDIMGTLFPAYGATTALTSGKLPAEVAASRTADILKGTPGVAGVPGALYNLFGPESEARVREGLKNLGVKSPFTQQDISQQNILPTSKYTPEYFSIGAGSPFGAPKTEGEKERRVAGSGVAEMVAPGALSKALGFGGEAYTAAYGPSSKITARARELGAAGEELATTRAVSAVDRRLDQVPELKRHIENLTPKVEARLADSRKEAGLPDPDSKPSFQAAKDIDSDVTKLIGSKFKSAEEIQRSVGGKAFEDYKIAAKVKQEAQPFGQSNEGKSLQKELDAIIAGGTGDLRKFGKAEIDIARDLRTELFGRRPQDISVKEIEEVASRLPPSFSQAARETQARNIILEKEARGRRPVDFQLVDNKLRELRQTESSKAPEAATAIARKRYGSAADLVESALKSWIGEENYPRAAYAESSEALNAFQNELNLASRERQRYETGEGEVKTARNPSDVMFRDRRSVQLSKDLLGEKEVNTLAERYAVNKVTSLGDPAKIDKWLDSKESTFINEIPGLSEKITKYSEALARREGDVKALEALQKRLAGVREDVPAISAGAQKAAEAIRSAVTRVETTDPIKLYDSFVSDIRPKMESTGVFSRVDLDQLEKDISAASKSANRKEAVDRITSSLVKAGTKLAIGGGTLYEIVQPFRGE
jgi:archaellum component FlaC